MGIICITHLNLHNNVRLEIMSDKLSEFIEQLFNAISNDPGMPAELKISLLRLQLPIHNLSLSDPSFISNPKHPARRTLFITKRLTNYAIDSTTILKTERILSELYNAKPNANKFAIINQQLEKLISSLETPDTKHNLPQSEKESQIKTRVSDKIKACIKGHNVPEPCQNLILKLWPSTFYQIIKQYGDSSQHWHNASNIYSELLSAIQGISNVQQHKKLKENYMNIVRKNNHTLLSYNQKELVEVSMKSLITHFNQVIHTSNYISNPAENNQQDILQKIASLPSSVKPGIWFEIYINASTPARRLRLSLINTNTGSLIFVNRKGIKKLEKDAADFTAELNKGLSSACKHDALFTKPTQKKQFRKIG